MPCVFCGAAGKLTREHVFPSWLEEVIPGEGSIKHKLIAPEGSESESWEWTTDALTLTAKVVCERCNNGWMNDLEGSARPFLEPMIRGHRKTLYAEGRRQVAHWGLKTAMMVDRAQEPEHQCVPAEDYRALYEAQDVLPDTFIWLGACRFGAGAGALHRTLVAPADPRTEPLDIDRRGFGATLLIGHLVFEIVRVGGRPGQTLEIGGQVGLRRFWPPVGDFTWPPSFALDRGEALTIGKRLSVYWVALP